VIETSQNLYLKRKKNVNRLTNNMAQTLRDTPFTTTWSCRVFYIMLKMNSIVYEYIPNTSTETMYTIGQSLV